MIIREFLIDVGMTEGKLSMDVPVLCAYMQSRLAL